MSDEQTPKIVIHGGPFVVGNEATVTEGWIDLQGNERFISYKVKRDTVKPKGK